MLITWAEVTPALEKLLTAAVKDSTDSTAPIPVNLVKIKASLVLDKVFSIERPCLANSVAASDTSRKDCPVCPDIVNKVLPNF